MKTGTGGSYLVDARPLLKALKQMKRGDFTVRLPFDQVGIGGELAEAFNDVAELDERLILELENIGKIVGREGKITQRASMGDVMGGWAAGIRAINALVEDLVRPTSEVARVIGAVARGDLSQTMPLEIDGGPLKGEFLRMARTINTMVNQLSSFTSEVTRVAREVGSEGKLGVQAQVRGVSGTWKDLTDSVNSMANNLTAQVRNIAEVTTAVAKGDLGKKITADVKGEILELKNTINTMVDQLSSFASEVTRVAKEVGTDGKLGGQAQVKGVSGTWKDLTDNVNSMASNLTAQVRNIANVTTAVATGDLSKKITVDVKGEVLELKNTINTMVDQLSSFASEVTRVAREVGTDGKLGGQARVKGVAGTWKDLTDSVNYMASNLTAQVRNIADVTTAVAKGDLSRKITVDVKGEISELKNTINVMVDQLRSFADEVTRVAREVGTEGKLGGQADVQGVSGTWKDLTDSVNYMASNLTAQVRNIADVTTAVAKGDLSRKITVDVKGEILELKDTINTMVDQLGSFADEVTRVAREVGSEGRLGGQADVKGVSGTWRDLTDSVNDMAGNLTAQVRNIAEVTTAVANGDLSKKITVNVRGEILELKNTINTMVDQLSSFAAEVTRVAREVGSEGKLGGQAQVKGVSGTWKDLTDNVNSMAGNLTGQVRNIAEVTTAVANGDLSRKITVDVKGEILELKNTINTMVDQLSSFAAEVTRVAREVGSEGKLGGQADVKGVSGTWKDLTDSVNYMAGNLTAQVRNIAEVTTAVAKGDLSKKITVDVKGEILELKNTINVMVDQLGSFAAEVTRVAREVGSEGKLGGQADVKGVSGTWRDLTDSVNYMAGNLTSQVRNIAEVTTAVANGDLSKKITVDVRGEIQELKNTINTMVDQLRSFADEVTRVAREVGTEGKLGGQAQVKGVSGTWKGLTDNVNYMASNLTSQVRNIADVTTAVARGDLSKKITVDVKGEILELKNTVNTMVDQLSSFAAEVTRVAREVGTEGKLGGQAEVKGVSGTWKDLTDNVNFMAGNLTNQVRGIAGVVTAVAQGNLKRKLVLEAKGEIAALADTINEMIDTLATFAEQVTTVAREVGVEGELGGQARVPGAAGTWKDLTDNVNQLAANLTNQIRAIAEVATAITKGDLTRSIAVEAQGEVAALKDLINEMIRNLKDTTQKNTEQDWLKTNLAKFTRMLQGQRDLLTVSNLILSELAPLVHAQHGVFYVNELEENNEQMLRLIGSYAYQARKRLSDRFKVGEGLVGQCAIERHRILLEDVPGDYIKIGSGLGETAPRNIVVLPVLFEGEVRAVIELASLGEFSEVHLGFLDQLTESIGIVINTIEANMRTENLLKQSQSLAKELQSQQMELTETNRRLEQQAKTLQASENLLTQQQEELQQTNQELQEKARLLAVQNTEVETKNQEIEQARLSLEDKAEQLALTSKYKSEFLANMSHELRTPLNSLLILSKLLAENAEGNLTRKQVEFAQTVHSAGAELLALINDILDLSKIESGTMSVDLSDLPFVEVKDDVERSFRAIAEEKGLDFTFVIKENAGDSIFTDSKRLQQVLKNLLSNAFKFTEKGGVMVNVYEAEDGWTPGVTSLDHADSVIAFAVTDTGIGIAPDKQKIIFEAFQQADGTTSRKYGGTGLGLAISREISSLLGGEIKVTSEPQKGSAFTFYVPRKYVAPSFRRPHKMLQTMELYGSQPEFDLSHEQYAEIETLIEDDRDRIVPGDKVILLLEDDEHFARLLLGLAREHGFKCLVSGSGETGVALARRYCPDAVTLDLHLADWDGWKVLDHLKRDASTKHIPVQVISVDDVAARLPKSGVIGYLEKPVTKEALDHALDTIRNMIERPAKRVLVVEHDDEHRRNILSLIGNGELEATAVSSGESALKELKEKHYDCMVVDLSLSDMSGFELARKVRVEENLTHIPIVVYAGNGKDGHTEEGGSTRAVVVQKADSPQGILDETATFLTRIDAGVQKKAINRRAFDDAMLINRKVLVIDDDVRNIFAVTSVLERHNVSVVYAENGGDGIQMLRENPDVDCILMDVMMPELDGYETMQQIRKMEKYKHLPIIALTARAMKGDREKCLEAGASDYIAKPVDTDELMSLIRVWLAKDRMENR